MAEAGFRWGVLLKGHDFDIEAWRNALEAPFDPHVTNTSHGPTLWSKQLQDAENTTEVWERAKSLLLLISSTMLHTKGSRRVDAEGVVEIDENGNERRHHVLELRGVEFGQDFGTVTITVDGETANTEDTEPAPSLQQTWLQIAVEQEQFLTLMHYALNTDDWFEIYKAIETLELQNGGEQRLMSLEWVDASSLKLLKRTANYYRHAEGKFDRPERPMNVGEARGLLSLLIRRAFDEELKRARRDT